MVCLLEKWLEQILIKFLGFEIPSYLVLHD